MRYLSVVLKKQSEDCMKQLLFVVKLFVILAQVIYPGYAVAAIGLDRTRVIFNGDQRSISIVLSNENAELPYLAQGWIEDENGNKIADSLTVLPPVQRIEPRSKSQVKIQSLNSLDKLPKDRESLFYFNLREIPPKPKKANTLQLALQTKIKLFYRPESVIVKRNSKDADQKIFLKKSDSGFEIINPTPYYISIVGIDSKSVGRTSINFEPFMVEPRGRYKIKHLATNINQAPILTYINDFGGRGEIKFSCDKLSCEGIYSL
jgi:P pilus assembly chaperone PapD